MESRNLPAIVESLNIQQGITFKALRRHDEQTITRRNQRIFNGDNDDNNIELLAALQIEFEQNQRANQAQHEIATRQPANTADVAKETDANNNNKKDKNLDDDDDNVNSKDQPLAQDTNNNNTSPTPSTSVTATTNAIEDTKSSKHASTQPINDKNETKSESPSRLSKFFKSLKIKEKL